MPRLEGKKMFLFLAPKKAGQAKKSQQRQDRERREAEAAEVDRRINEEAAGDGLAANAKGLDALAKLKEEMPGEE